ncbi:MAG: hypothetical protein ACRD04_09515 [Terriglobales bacterium]
MSLEEELRAALRREEPPHDLAPAVVARLHSPAPRPAHGWSWAQTWVLLLVLAVAGFGVTRWAAMRQQRQARQDGQQLVAALRLASNELSAVRAKVVRSP